jgi:hypothetical protein
VVVVFTGVYGTFGGIASMNARWRKLEVNVFLSKELLQGFSAFIVEALKAGL